MHAPHMPWRALCCLRMKFLCIATKTCHVAVLKSRATGGRLTVRPTSVKYGVLVATAKHSCARHSRCKPYCI